MADLKNVMSSIVRRYPYKNEMSNARLTKMVYLSDWHHTLHHNKRMTDIDWYFDNFGPFVWDVKNEAEKEDEIFTLERTFNIKGSAKTIIRLIDDDLADELSATELKSVKKIIKLTKSLYWDNFITFVYSTYPIANSDKYSYLDLDDLAKKFRAERVAVA